MDRYKLRPDLPWYAHALYWVSLLAFMALFIVFVLPLIYRYVSIPLGDWAYETVRQWTGEPYKPRS